MKENYDHLWPAFTADDQTYVEVSNSRRSVSQVELSNPAKYRAARAIQQWKKDYGSEVSIVDNFWREVFLFIFKSIISIIDLLFDWISL